MRNAIKSPLASGEEIAIGMCEIIERAGTSSDEEQAILQAIEAARR